MWSQANKTQYDRDREPPVRAWNFSRDTPVIPINFLSLQWFGSWHPHGTRSSEFLASRIAKRPPSLIICDLYPYTCMRMSHSRFVIPSNSLIPNLCRNAYLQLNEGLLDQYIVDEDELINTILNLLHGQTRVIMGLQERVIEMVDYCYSLGDILNKGVDKFVMTTDPEEDSD